MKTIFLGADHNGWKMKEFLKRRLLASGRKVEDLSPELKKDDDYPPVAFEAGRRVARDPQTQAILICGTGLGMDIAANRLKGVRAVVARDPREAKFAREHNHANVLVLGGWSTSNAQAEKILEAWFKTRPSRAARHARRVRQLDETKET